MNLDLLTLEVEHNDWSVGFSVFVEVDDLACVVLDSLEKIGIGVRLPFHFRHQHVLDSGFMIIVEDLGLQLLVFSNQPRFRR
jgi:hypothetical protein